MTEWQGPFWLFGKKKGDSEPFLLDHFATRDQAHKARDTWPGKGVEMMISAPIPASTEEEAAKLAKVAFPA